MVLSPDQERVKTLLKDTITLLCRNGLNFQATFCIDAVIGVTLDDSQLFYMSMNEVVKSEKALLRERQEQEGLVSSSPAKRRPDDKRHRHRKRVKRESADRDPGDSDVSQESYSSGDNDNEESFISQVKNELNDAANDDEDDSNDIVFIKQELDQQWPPSTTAATTQDSSADGAYYSGAGPSTEGYPDPPDFSSMSLVPVGGGDSWGGGGYPPHMAGRGRATPRTATATSPGDPQPGLSQQVVEFSDPPSMDDMTPQEKRLAVKIVLSKGAIATVRSTIRACNSTYRPSAHVVRTIMAYLESAGFGVFERYQNLFIKKKEPEPLLLQTFNISSKQYRYNIAQEAPKGLSRAAYRLNQRVLDDDFP